MNIAQIWVPSVLNANMAWCCATVGIMLSYPEWLGLTRCPVCIENAFPGITGMQKCTAVNNIFFLPRCIPHRPRCSFITVAQLITPQIYCPQSEIICPYISLNIYYIKECFKQKSCSDDTYFYVIEHHFWGTQWSSLRFTISIGYNWLACIEIKIYLINCFVYPIITKYNLYLLHSFR